MAWRPSEYVKDGELNNTVPGHVTGWMSFFGKRNKVKFDLNGDFHRDLRGAAIKFHNEQYKDVDPEKAKKYLRAFSTNQTGVVGDITARLAPFDYGRTPYVEWYGDDNGRCVVELDPSQVEIIGKPIPYSTTKPVDRKVQGENMMTFIMGLVGKTK